MGAGSSRESSADQQILYTPYLCSYNTLARIRATLPCLDFRQATLSPHVCLPIDVVFLLKTSSEFLTPLGDWQENETN